MQPIISTDSFDAFTADNGILIKEKKKSAAKFSLFAIAMGVVFVAISLIDLSNTVGELIYTIFFYVFRWGGIFIAAIGIVTFLVKGLLAPNATVMIDKEKREINLRGKIIPFAEINSVSMQAQEMFGRQMTAIFLDHQGKKKPLISGPVLSDGNKNVELDQFVSGVNNLVKS